MAVFGLRPPNFSRFLTLIYSPNVGTIVFSGWDITTYIITQNSNWNTIESSENYLNSFQNPGFTSTYTVGFTPLAGVESFNHREGRWVAPDKSAGKNLTHQKMGESRTSENCRPQTL